MDPSDQKTDRVRKYLQQLSLQVRSHLLTEIERLRLYGDEVPGADLILDHLRAEFRNGGQTQERSNEPARYFFMPLEPVLVDLPPDRANAGQISRGSLTTIWNWMSQSLLPAMAKAYMAEIKPVIAAKNHDDATRIAVTFQGKVTRILEDAIATPEGAARVRAELATYTSLAATFDDLSKILGVLRARDALAQFGLALPAKIVEFEDQSLSKVRKLLDAFVAKQPDAMPFALTMVAKRLAIPWQLIRLAAKGSTSKKVTDIAATTYASAVSMVLDHLDARRLVLRDALKTTRVVIAKDILADIYDIEHAIRVRIDGLEDSDWGRRLDEIMQGIAALVDAEVKRNPGEVRHVLQSRRLRSHESLSGRLTFLAWKARDAVTDAQTYCRKLVGGRQKVGG
jgi:hypothetical protein